MNNFEIFKLLLFQTINSTSFQYLLPPVSKQIPSDVLDLYNEKIDTTLYIFNYKVQISQKIQIL